MRREKNCRFRLNLLNFNENERLSPSQDGNAPLQRPLVKHLRSLSPLKLNPLLQEYLTTLPKE